MGGRWRTFVFSSNIIMRYLLYIKNGVLPFLLPKEYKILSPPCPPEKRALNLRETKKPWHHTKNKFGPRYGNQTSLNYKFWKNLLLWQSNFIFQRFSFNLTWVFAFFRTKTHFFNRLTCWLLFFYSFSPRNFGKVFLFFKFLHGFWVKKMNSPSPCC